MSDTVYIQEGTKVTRYWDGEKGDCVQITIPRQMTLAEFRLMVMNVERSVKETEDAWWHKVDFKGGTG